MNNVTENATKLTNKEILAQIKLLSEEKRTRKNKLMEIWKSAYSEYSAWSKKEYRAKRNDLLKMLADNHTARIAKLEEKKTAALEKAEAIVPEETAIEPTSDSSAKPAKKAAKKSSKKSASK